MRPSSPAQIRRMITAPQAGRQRFPRRAVFGGRMSARSVSWAGVHTGRSYVDDGYRRKSRRLRRTSHNVYYGKLWLFAWHDVPFVAFASCGDSSLMSPD
jgi:hypothetical protein